MSEYRSTELAFTAFDRPSIDWVGLHTLISRIEDDFPSPVALEDPAEPAGIKQTYFPREAVLLADFIALHREEIVQHWHAETGEEEADPEEEATISRNFLDRASNWLRMAGASGELVVVKEVFIDEIDITRG